MCGSGFPEGEKIRALNGQSLLRIFIKSVQEFAHGHGLWYDGLL